VVRGPRLTLRAQQVLGNAQNLARQQNLGSTAANPFEALPPRRQAEPLAPLVVKERGASEPSLPSLFTPRVAPLRQRKADELMTTRRNALSERMLLAARNGDKDAVSELVAAGADLDARDADGRGVLHYLSRNQKHAAWLKDLAHRESRDAKDNLGFTPLFEAVLAGNVRGARVLLEAGAHTDARDSRSRTALHHSARLGRCDVLELLLQSGSLIDGDDEAGRTALHYAAAVSSDCVELLLSYGANASLVDKDGKTAEVVAEEVGHSESKRALQRERERKAEASGKRTRTEKATSREILEQTRKTRAANRDLQIDF
jgi:ankyrin repeat protein